MTTYGFQFCETHSVRVLPADTIMYLQMIICRGHETHLALQLGDTLLQVSS